MDTGNRGIQRNLENALNQEISINLNKKEDLLNDFKNLQREIDPNVLKQPEF